MHPSRTCARRAVAFCLLVAVLVSSRSAWIPASASATVPDDALPAAPAAYPADPSQPIPWKGGFATLADVQAAFNFGRSSENTQLSVFIKPLVMPAPAEWAAKSDGEKVLWLLNQERTARGLLPLHGLEKNVNEVAQGYAQWLLDNDAWGHNADGGSPKARLNSKTAINACHDPLDIDENLASQATSSPNPIPFVLEQAVYSWLYDDAGEHKWGHRHAILWTPYADNSGPAGSEGFIGLGRARGSYTIKGKTYANSEVIVLNFFDPCATWQYAAAPVVPPPPAPVVKPPTVPPNTRTAAGVTRLPIWQIIEEQPFEANTWPDSKWFVDETGAGDYRWIPSTCRVYAGNYSAMALGGGVDGNNVACADPYPHNANSWLIYGPFDLADAVMADFSAMVWVYTEPYVDILCLAASTDRRTFNGPCVSGASITGEDDQGKFVGWVQEHLDLNRVYRFGSLLGKQGLYIALVFQTNGSGSRPHMGVYADNVVLRKAILPVGAQAAAGDAAGQPLYGVQLTDETGRRVMSNNDGTFDLMGLTPGVHTLTPSRLGYLFYPSQVTVDVSRQDVRDLAFTAVNAGQYRVALPYLRRTAPGAQNADASPASITRSDSTFILDCDARGCTMRGPLP